MCCRARIAGHGACGNFRRPPPDVGGRLVCCIPREPADRRAHNGEFEWSLRRIVRKPLTLSERALGRRQRITDRPGPRYNPGMPTGFAAPLRARRRRSHYLCSAGRGTPKRRAESKADRPSSPRRGDTGNSGGSRHQPRARNGSVASGRSAVSRRGLPSSSSARRGAAIVARYKTGKKRPLLLLARRRRTCGGQPWTVPAFQLTERTAFSSAAV